MSVPAATDPGQSLAVILGLPFDCGTHPTRIGSRLGPNAIRDQSLLLRRFDGASSVDPLEFLKVVDLGDAAVTSGDVSTSYRIIEDAVALAASKGAITLTLGGDGAIALPEMRALSKKHGPLCVVHIDAHTDAYPIEGFNTATAFSRACEENLVDTSRSFHIGGRRSHMVPGVYEYGRSLGYQIVTMDQLLDMGISTIMQNVRSTIGDRPVYLCYDMDFFDPSAAPGVCTPAWGGATAREGLEVLKGVQGLNIIGADINTISPPHDINGMSAFLAATVAYELLVLLAHKERTRQAD